MLLFAIKNLWQMLSELLGQLPPEDFTVEAARGQLKHIPEKRAHGSRVSSHIPRPWEETECTHWRSRPFRRHGRREGGGGGGVWEEERGGLLPARVPLSRLQMSSSTSSRWQQLSVHSLLNRALSNHPKTTLCLTPKPPVEVFVELGGEINKTSKWLVM